MYQFMYDAKLWGIPLTLLSSKRQQWFLNVLLGYRSLLTLALPWKRNNDFMKILILC